MRRFRLPEVVFVLKEVVFVLKVIKVMETGGLHLRTRERARHVMQKQAFALR